MSRWTGPGRFTAQGEGALSRNRLADLQSRARKVVGELENQVRLGGIWQGYRRVRLEDGIEVLASVDATYPDNPIVQARLLIDPQVVKEEDREIIPLISGFSFGRFITGSSVRGPQFLVAPDGSMGRVGKDKDQAIDYTVPEDAVDTGIFNFTEQFPSPVEGRTPSDLLASSTIGWESTDGSIYIALIGFTGQVSRTSFLGGLISDFEISDDSDTNGILKNGYVWSGTPPTAGRYNGMGVYQDNEGISWLVVILLVAAGANPKFQAFRRRYRPFPYSSNTLGDSEDPFTWEAMQTYDVPPRPTATGFARMSPDDRISVDPGFIFSSSGKNAATIIYNERVNTALNGAAHSIITYTPNGGFSEHTPWTYTVQSYAGGQGQTIIKGPTPVEADYTRSGSVSGPTPFDVCQGGAASGTRSGSESREWNLTSKLNPVTAEKIREFIEVEGGGGSLDVDISTKQPLAVDYKFGTEQLTFLWADIGDGFFDLEANHTSTSSGTSNETYECIVGDSLVGDKARTTYSLTESGDWSFQQLFSVSGGMLKIDDEPLGFIDSFSQNWSGAWSSSSSASGWHQGLQGDVQSFTGSVTWDITFNKTNNNIAKLIAVDLRFSEVWFLQEEGTTSFTVSTSATGGTRPGFDNLGDGVYFFDPVLLNSPSNTYTARVKQYTPATGLVTRREKPTFDPFYEEFVNEEVNGFDEVRSFNFNDFFTVGLMGRWSTIPTIFNAFNFLDIPNSIGRSWVYPPDATGSSVQPYPLFNFFAHVGLQPDSGTFSQAFYTPPNGTFFPLRYKPNRTAADFGFGRIYNRIGNRMVQVFFDTVDMDLTVVDLNGQEFPFLGVTFTGDLSQSGRFVDQIFVF